jgi:hypothetical protein
MRRDDDDAARAPMPGCVVGRPSSNRVGPRSFIPFPKTFVSALSVRSDSFSMTATVTAVGSALPTFWQRTTWRSVAVCRTLATVPTPALTPRSGCGECVCCRRVRRVRRRPLSLRRSYFLCRCPGTQSVSSPSLFSLSPSPSLSLCCLPHSSSSSINRCFFFPLSLCASSFSARLHFHPPSLHPHLLCHPRSSCTKLWSRSSPPLLFSPLFRALSSSLSVWPATQLVRRHSIN